MNYDVNHDAQKAHMRGCLEAALAVWDHIYTNSEPLPTNNEPGSETYVTGSISLGEIRVILTKHFPLFSVNTDHCKAAMTALRFTVTQLELTSCACFEFAHELDHIFDLEDLGVGETAH